MKRRISALACIVVMGSFLGIGSSRAEPGPVATYLMHEPVSLLEWGCHIIQHQLEAQSREMMRDYDISVMVMYNWEKNRIIVSANMFSKSGYEHAKAKDLNIRFIRLVRRFFALDPETSKPIMQSDKPTSLAASFFVHNGYSSHNEPDDLYSEIDSLMEIEVFTSLAGFQCLFSKCGLLEQSIFESVVSLQEAAHH